MKKSLFIHLTCISLLLGFSGTASAGSDRYVGDTAIYSGSASGVKANVLFLIDNSAGMRQSGVSEEYKSGTTYTGTYSPNAVYVRQAATAGTINYNLYIDSVDDDVSCSSAQTQLKGPGAYYGPLKKSDGSCNASQSGNYYLGNLLNYLSQPAQTPPEWAANHSYSEGDKITVDGKIYLCSQAGTSGGTKPGSWPTTYEDSITDGTAIWILNPDSIIEMIESTVGQVTAASRNSINVGLMVFGDNNHGAKVIRPVQDISESSANGPSNYANLITSINGLSSSLLSSNQQPVNEALWDAGLYYRGQNSSNLKVSSDTADYPSPIEYSCQENNYIIVLTTGNSPDTVHTKSLLTDLNSDGTDGDAADAALFNFDRNTQSVHTTVVQLLSVEVPILKQAAERGSGNYYNVWDTTHLTDALHDAIVNIVKEIDTSFVAPVVPVSPENRTYSGSRVYMGFFKPITERYWNGNLKKYGIDSNNNITDKDGDIATWVDIDGDGKDDIISPTADLPADAVNGSFKSDAHSFWSSEADAGDVESGGAGGVLVDRNFSTDPRNIYTYTGTSADLTNAANAFTTANAGITASILFPGDATKDNTDKDNLVKFIHGLDPYDEDNNSQKDEKRGKNAFGEEPIAGGWIMGDVLHSKPLIVNYSTFDFEVSGNESNCTTNKSMIYVGSNDGMLHAFKDCNGTEAWAFVPPDLLGTLQNMTGETHNYYVDSSPSVYILDHNKNGNIETPDINSKYDKVILVFGQRRGGGSDTAPAKGTYYALDVSNPASPVFLWSISNSKVVRGTTSTNTTDFYQLAETWSEPKLVRMKIGSSEKIIAFVGAGYDNPNEDGRYGATQTFLGTGTASNTDIGKGNVTSASSVAGDPLDPRGRGVYAIELATMSGGVPDFTNSGTKVRGITHASYADMLFSFPGEISALDMNSDGYVDRLYGADTGGNIWRFDVGNTDPAAWTARKIFSSNPGSGGASDKGRKVFYKPSVVIEPDNTVMLFFGTGDREHPLNWAVTDRFYALKDKGQATEKTESDLLDVTNDDLQTSADAGVISNILTTLSAAGNYGWYIKLNQNSGEKVLAPPTVFNKVAYFTTYAPNTALAPDPCDPGNLGTARLYAVDYKTGEAVINYDKTNDTSTTTNKRALTTPGQVLLRSDRIKTIGSGIPSGIVMIISPSGALKTLIGVGGVIPGENPKKGGSIIPLYWRQK